MKAKKNRSLKASGDGYGIAAPSSNEIKRLVALFNRGGYQEAEVLARSMTVRFPRHGFAWKVLGPILKEKGRMPEALSAMQKAVILLPNDYSVHYNLGIIFQDQGEFSQAEASYLRALELNPENAEVYNNLGNTYKALEKFSEAENSLRSALKYKPNFAMAYNNLGNIIKEQGRWEEAEENYRQAIKFEAGYAEAYSNLGNILKDQGNLGEAEVVYRRALELKPDFFKVYYNLGNVLLGQGRLSESEACYRQALKLNPDFIDAYNNLGVSLHKQGRFIEAETSYRRALELNSEYPEVLSNLGSTLRAFGRYSEAEMSLNLALKFKPDYAEAYINLGVTFHDQGRLNEAVVCCQIALALNPDYIEAYNNLGVNFHKQERLTEAEACYQKALTLKPDYADAYLNLGLTLQNQGRAAESEGHYRHALEIKPDFKEAFSNLLFVLNYHPDKSCEEIFEEYRNFDARFGLPHKEEWQPHMNRREMNRRLKVGYVSPQFNQHPICNFLEPLLSHHNKEIFEVYAYAEFAKEDAATTRYKSYMDHWIPTKGLTDVELAGHIRNDGIDILVDIAGHTAGNRLSVFARKPAPVSLHWLDFGYTTGLTAIDYYLTDRASVPIGSEELFSETPWRLETPSFAYCPAEGMGKVNSLPAKERGYVTFGTLTRAIRINHRTIRVWSEILKRVKGSRLVIDSGNFKDSAMQVWLAEKFAAQGIARDRLEIGYHSPPWDVLRGLDIGLDCFPHNSGTTLFESLYMGVPFISLADRPSVGRLGSSILEGVGHPEWITRTESEYVECAVAMASDLPRLDSLRAGLRGEMESGPLMDEPAFARKVEAAYREMFVAWCEGGQAVSNQQEQVAVQDSSHSFDEILQHALALHQSGRFQETEHLYLQLLRAQPNHSILNYNLGLLAVQMGQPATSLPYFETALEANPEDGGYWLRYIDALVQAGKEDSARQILEIAVQSGLQGEEVDTLSVRLGVLLKNTSVMGSDPEGRQDSTRLKSKKKGQQKQSNKSLGSSIAESRTYEIERLVALFSQGRYQEAEILARSLIARFPEHGFAWKVLGPILQQQGRQAEALSAMQKAVVLLPKDVETHYNLGIVYQDKGEHAKAEASYRRVLELASEYAEAYNNLGTTLKSLGKTDEAETSLRLALKHKPDFPEAYNNLGNLLKEAGRIKEAKENYRLALKIKPDFIMAYSNLGNICKDQGYLVEAEACYRHALEFKPNFAEVLYNLGNTKRLQGDLAESVTCFHQALEIKPDFAEAHNNLGVSFKEQGLLEKAETCYRRALELNPQYAEAYSNLGSIFSLQGRFYEAETSLRFALELNPHYAKAHSNLLFLMNYHPDKKSGEIFQLYRNFDAHFGVPLRREWQSHRNSTEIHRRLKVGYVNPQFCQHPVQYFLEPLLAHHDKDIVEVYAYAELYKEDAVTDRYKSYVDHWVPTTILNDTDMVEQIRSDGIDILIDIAGHTGGNRLSVFARKPAPVSMHWLDFGYTTGLSAIDYYLTDNAIVPVGSEGLFSEIPWRLETPSFAYRQAEGMGEVSPLPAKERGYVTFGTLTRAIRINHRTIRVWSEILKRVQGARLVIDSGIFKDSVMQEDLAEKFIAQGIDRERLEIGFHSPPWDVLRGLDIGLDCFPHNSGTTLFETLYMGVPFITLADRPSVGTLGSSVLEGVGHSEWIARTEDEYVECAVAMASDLPRLDSLRAGLRGEMESGPLMDEPAFARKVEAAYREMFKKWCEEQR